MIDSRQSTRTKTMPYSVEGRFQGVCACDVLGCRRLREGPGNGKGDGLLAWSGDLAWPAEGGPGFGRNGVSLEASPSH